MLITKRSLLWAATGSIVGVVLWSVVGGTLWLLQHPEPAIGAALRAWPVSVLYTAFWASVVGLVAIPIYVVVFAIWQVYVRAHPSADRSERHRAVTAFMLGSPMAVVVTWRFGDSFAGFQWSEAAWIAPVAFFSCWGAVWMPRRFLRSLRAPLWPSAGEISAPAT